MKPHELVHALFLQRKDIPSVSALARAISNQGFQGTLSKFLNGQVPHPKAETASRISKFFGIPLEALYDTKVSTRIAKERGLLPDSADPVHESAEEQKAYRVAPASWPFKRISPTQISNLSSASRAQLERLIAAYLDSPIPASLSGDDWHRIAHKLASDMDRDFRLVVYSEFVRQVEALARKHEAATATPRPAFIS